MNERIGLGKVRIFVLIGLIGLLMSKNLFSQGSLFPVKIDNKWGFIDKNGKMIVSPEFDAVGNYSESFIPVKIGGEGRDGEQGDEGFHLRGPQKKSNDWAR